MAKCEVVGCDVEVNKQGHSLCYDHWKAKRDGELSTCASCGQLKEDDKPLCYPCFKKKASKPEPSESPKSEPLSSTLLGEAFGLSAQKINLVLAELGWVTKGHKGWSATPQGLKVGAVARENRQTGIPYVVWRPEVVSNRALTAAIGGEGDSLSSHASASAQPPAAIEDANFRDRFSVGAYCAQDGHRVRSRAELVIDDWLYQHRIIHAYERRLPVDQPAVCDFWLPVGRVYIEYWGMEQDPEYAARKRHKKAIYEMNELQLIELADPELKSLEDHLPRLLRKFGIEVD